MTISVDDTLTFAFPDGFQAVKWDESKTHRALLNTWQFACACEQCPSRRCSPKHRDASCEKGANCRVRSRDGLKAVDLVCLREDELYLLEVKDFNRSHQSKVQDLNDDSGLSHYVVSIAKKFRDTLFSLWIGGSVAWDSDEMRFAEQCRRSSRQIYFVFHCERPDVPYQSGFFHRGKAVSSETVREAISKYVGGALSANLKVVDCAEMSAHPQIVPWKATFRRGDLIDQLRSQSGIEKIR